MRSPNAPQRDGLVGDRSAVAIVEIRDLAEIARLRGSEVADEVVRLLTLRIRSEAGATGQTTMQDRTTFAIAFAESSVREMREWSTGLIAALDQPVVVDGEPISFRSSVSIRMGAADQLVAGSAMVDARDGHLEWSLIQGDFVLLYQPTVMAKTGNIVGFEALLRSSGATAADAVAGVTPGQFVRDLDRSVLAAPISTWVFEQACRDAQAHKRATGRNRFLSIQIGSCTFADETFVSIVLEALASSGLAPQSLLVELEPDCTLSTEAVAHLRAHGVRIGLTGIDRIETLPEQLRALPVDSIRIPTRLTRWIGDGVAIAELCKLAKERGVLTIADGIAEAEQRERLHTLGCDLVQGSLCGSPQRASRLLAKLASAPTTG